MRLVQAWCRIRALEVEDQERGEDPPVWVPTASPEKSRLLGMQSQRQEWFSP